ATSSSGSTSSSTAVTKSNTHDSSVSGKIQGMHDEISKDMDGGASKTSPSGSGWRGTPPASSDSKTSGSSSADPSTLSKDAFMSLGNDAFMQAVIAGKIPKEITDSPAAMQSLQARMNNISEMNQLMTSMINAVHQMEMSVIQNVRV